MPLFDYVCEFGHVLKDVHVRLDGSDAPASCPEQIQSNEVLKDDHAGVWAVCGAALTRRLPLVASTFPGAAGWRK